MSDARSLALTAPSARPSASHPPPTAIYLNFTNPHIQDEFERKW